MNDGNPARPLAPSHSTRVAVAVVAIAALATGSLAGCSKKDSSSSATTTTSVPGTATSSPATTGAPGTTAAPGTSATTTSTLARPAVPMTITQSTDGTSPNGSGCTPPAGDSLPDGIWFGYTKSVDTTKPTLTLDLACFFTGPAATKAAGRTPDDPIENDYFIKNENPKLYTLPLAEDVEVLRLQNAGNTAEYEPTTTGPGEAADAAKAFGDYFLTWIAISGGKVVVVQQQFVP